MPFFSVIIPVHNRAPLIGTTLESVLAQQYTDYEVLVVDDGSTDGSAEVVAGFGESVTLLTQANAGPGAARNHAASRASGQYLAFLDSDDLWLPWTLSTQAEAIASTDRPAMLAGAPHWFTDGQALPEAPAGALAVRQYPDFLASGLAERRVGTSRLTIRSDVFHQAGGITEAIWNNEDIDLTLRLGTAPGFVVITHPATVARRMHEVQLSGNPASSHAGKRFMLQREAEGVYPGGRARERARRVKLAAEVRTGAMEGVRGGRLGLAWDLYRRSFGWQLRLGRWRFLVGLPAHLGLAGLRRVLSPNRNRQ
jgi:glycosyltransferase involved in cell wall biosynthesis